MRIEWNVFILSTRDYVKKNDGKAYTNNNDEGMLEYYRLFGKKINPLSPEPELSDFYYPSEAQKRVNYYLLQLVQLLQDMPCISTLNK